MTQLIIDLAQVCPACALGLLHFLTLPPLTGTAQSYAEPADFAIRISALEDVIAAPFHGTCSPFHQGLRPGRQTTQIKKERQVPGQSGRANAVGCAQRE